MMSCTRYFAYFVSAVTPLNISVGCKLTLLSHLFTDEAELAKVQQNPVGLFCRLLRRVVLDGGDERRFGQNVVLELDVVRATAAAIHHKVSEIQVLLCSPPDKPINRHLSQARAKYRIERKHLIYH